MTPVQAAERRQLAEDLLQEVLNARPDFRAEYRISHADTSLLERIRMFVEGDYHNDAEILGRFQIIKRRLFGRDWRCEFCGQRIKEPQRR